MTDSSNRPNPVVLCILDGWGHRDENEDNAIAIGNTPTWDRLIKECPHSLLETSGKDVGLPDGQMGNSEVGHMNLGAGRVVMQDLPRIDAAFEDNSVKEMPTFKKLVSSLKKTGGTCHLMGLMSPGGVHSHQDHIAALAKCLAEEGVPVTIHAFMDGRDTPPSSGAGYIKKLFDEVGSLNALVSGTVSGRFYAMDRDQRWDRVERAYNAIVLGEGEAADSPVSAVKKAYTDGTTDEFVLPTVVAGYKGMEDGDAILMANFRADRAREILQALADKNFDGFVRKKTVKLSACVGMTEYSKDHNKFMDTIFPPEELTNIFGEIVSKAGLTQLRIAETEKYAHVTFFFNGGKESTFEGEDRILIPSPKVATYDLQPEMSAPEVCDNLVDAIENQKFDVIIANFANGDMVGHTGILDAAVKAVETVDTCLARLDEALKKTNGTMLVIADHGNCEKMRDPETGEAYTAHTIGVVPALLVQPPAGVTKIADGRLADVAPTLLSLLGMKKPGDMTGVSLID